MKTTVLLGPPGTGKTTRLLTYVEEALASGLKPEEIAFVAFSRAAASEAVERAAARFHLPAKAFVHFRTLHAMAYHQLGMRRADVLDQDDWSQIATNAGEATTATVDDPSDFVAAVRTPVDAYRRVYELSLTQKRSPHAVWLDLDTSDPIAGASWVGCQRFLAHVEVYSLKTGKRDFTRMLLHYAERGAPLPVKLAIVDEAQDLTALQWQVVYVAFAHAERLIVAGDDDQAIYEWAGADVAQFMRVAQEADERIVLPQSYRLPRRVWEIAVGRLAAMRTRIDKDFAPRDTEGDVQVHGTVRDALMAAMHTSGDVRVLARNNYLLDDVEHHLRALGIAYSRHGRNVIPEADLLAMLALYALQQGQSINGKMFKALLTAMGGAYAKDADHLKSGAQYTPRDPGIGIMDFAGWSYGRREYVQAVCGRHGLWGACSALRNPHVQLDTIHAAKGKEADAVVLLSDTSARTQSMAMRSAHGRDTEHRVFYVGVTRAKRALHVVQPTTADAYQWGS